jgi:hypothetical protein
MATNLIFEHEDQLIDDLMRIIESNLGDAEYPTVKLFHLTTIIDARQGE